jgi:hypothetical protein
MVLFFALAEALLLEECDRFLQQAACAPQRRDLALRIQALQTQLDTALATDDFESVASVGPQLLEQQKQCAQLPLSEKD